MPNTIYVYDLRQSYRNAPDKANNDEGYDINLFVVSLQGLVNRDGPKLLVYGRDYIRSFSRFTDPYADGWDGNIDQWWIDRFMEPGGWLEGYEIQMIHDLPALVATFREQIPGLIVWDPEVDATLNVACTAAGVEGCPVVRYDVKDFYENSDEPPLYRWLVEELKIPVRLNLVGKFTGKGTIPDSDSPSTGSAKCDAYRWAKEQYLVSGKCNAALIGYYEDGHARKPGTNIINWEALRDYLVMKKGFVLDLSVWDDEAPNDDPTQPLGADCAMLRECFQAAYDLNGGEKITMLGFVPWNDKYTDHVGGKHGPVDSEWELVSIGTRYNGYFSVDCVNQGFTGNLSLHCHAPFPERVVQHARPTPRAVENKTYLTWFGGDYGDIGGIYNLIPALWKQKGRGKVPIGWSITPFHVDLCPGILKYLWDTQTDADWFVAGPSALGYNAPNNLQPRDYETFVKENIEYYSRLDYSISAFFIDWEAPNEQSRRLFARFSGDGLGSNWDPGMILTDNMPSSFVQYFVDFHTPLDLAAERIFAATEKLGKPGEEPLFLNVRTIWQEPDYLVALTEKLKAERPGFHYEIVDPYTFYYLQRAFLGGSNEHRATILSDTIPAIMEADKSYEVSVTIRNDGWDTWISPTSWGEQYTLEELEESDIWGGVALIYGFNENGELDGRHCNGGGVDIEGPVPPGGTEEMRFEMIAPDEPGEYCLVLEMHGEKGSFTDLGDLPALRRIVVI